MAYNKATLSLTPAGDGWINKEATNKFGLNSGEKINIFVNHKREIIIYKDWTGYSMRWCKSGMRFKALALATFLQLKETEAFTIICYFTADLVQKPDFNHKVCSRCDVLKNKSEFTEGLTFCNKCKRKNENAKKLAKVLVDSVR